MKTVLMTLTALLLLAGTTEAQQLQATTDGTLLTCESQNNVRHTCRADLRGRMVSLHRQLSDNDCILGKTWGTTRNRRGIWVDSGCRAQFLIGTGTTRQAFGRLLVCESILHDRKHCPADTSYGVELARQISKSDCVRGEDWGFDEKGVWVNNGCRGEFVLGKTAGIEPMASSTRPLVVCESVNNTENRCAADTTFGVTLSRRLSQNDCIRGESWGFDANGIWVSKGCRAEFIVGR